MDELKIKRLRENAVLPVRATEGAAGLDLSACLDAPLAIPSGGRALIPTGIAIELPGPEVAALLFARSSLGIKRGLMLTNGVGVIDSDYRGEIRIGVYNFTNEPCIVENGERLAQLVTVPLAGLAAAEAASLGDTARGAGGFGSTGSMAVKEEER